MPAAISRFRNGKGLALPPDARSSPTYIDYVTLGANTNKTITVPAGARYVRMRSNNNFFAKKNSDAAIPGADISDGSCGELNPDIWDLTAETSPGTVGATTTIGLISRSASTDITLSYYS